MDIKERSETIRELIEQMLEKRDGYLFVAFEYPEKESDRDERGQFNTKLHIWTNIKTNSQANTTPRN